MALSEFCVGLHAHDYTRQDNGQDDESLKGLVIADPEAGFAHGSG